MKHPQTLREKFYRHIVFFSILIAIAASIFGYQISKRVYRSIIPNVLVLKYRYPVPIGKDADGKTILYRLDKKRPANWLKLNQISKYAVAAVIMSEDGSFFRHKGYDPVAMKAAWEYNRKPTTKIKRGASTLTQQVVKNVFLTHEKTMTRKIRELLLAAELERVLTKKQILEVYFNIVEWGPGIYGIEAAARKYFHKSAAELTPKDAATLAFMLPNPTKYQHSIKSEGELSDFGKERVESIMNRMFKAGYISEEEFSSYFKPETKEESFKEDSQTDDSDLE